MAAKIDMAKFAKFCKDNGFIYQSSEIYGGINGFWDYGPLGVELKKNIKDAWWLDMVRNPPPGPDGKEIRMVGLDCSIIMNPAVWVASGHVGAFADPMVNCVKCRKLFRADKLKFVRLVVTTEINIPHRGIAEQAQSCPKYITIETDDPEELVKSSSKMIKRMTNEAKLSNDKVKEILVSHNQPNTPEDIQAFVKSLKISSHSEVINYSSIPKDLVVDCPIIDCGGALSEPRAFNLMNETHTGPIKSDENLAYLRPETAQGIFVNYRNVLNSTRLKLPFGIAQIGKAFRNEINPRNFTFRSREFEQMEIEFFCHPSESMKWYEYWRDLRKRWYGTLGIQLANLIPREQGKDELAFYSLGTTDIEYMFPFSEEPQELEGVAHRGSYDLEAHAKHSGKVDDLAYFDEERWNNDSQTLSTRSFKEWLKSEPSAEDIGKYKFVPHVIEPSAGADRFTLAVLTEAYHEEELIDGKGQKDTRIVMKFHPRLAPIKAAIFPLVNKEGMPELATKLYRELKPLFNVFYDDKGAVGRRYRRQDEIGTPFCITIDGDTVKDGTVTIRDRDSMQQRRIPMSEVKSEIQARLMPG